MGKNPPANAGDLRDAGSIPALGRFPDRGHGNPLFLPREFQGKRCLAGYGPEGYRTTEATEHEHQQDMHCYLCSINDRTHLAKISDLPKASKPVSGRARSDLIAGALK